MELTQLLKAQETSVADHDAVRCIHLTKQFGSSLRPFVAVQDLSFCISQGESVAFLGPNGAGKSTTIKLLCGILTPSSGQALLLNQKAGSKNALRQLGLVFGTRTQLWMNLSVLDSLRMTCEIYDVPQREHLERIQTCAEMFQVQDLLSKLTRSLSLGQRMRCEIVAAILHKPKILLLDEPTIGLDVVSKFMMRDMLTKWKKDENTTLLLTSHDMSDVEKLCQRVLLINKGKLEFDGQLAAFKGQLGNKRRISLWLQNALNAESQSENARKIQNEVVPDRIEKNGYLHVFGCNQDTVESQIQLILKHYSGNVQDIRIEDIPLEEIIHSRYSS